MDAPGLRGVGVHIGGRQGARHGAGASCSGAVVLRASLGDGTGASSSLVADHWQIVHRHQVECQGVSRNAEFALRVLHLEAEALVRVGVERRGVNQPAGVDVGDADGQWCHHGHAIEAEHALPRQAGDLHASEGVGWVLVCKDTKVGCGQDLSDVFGHSHQVMA